MPVVENPPVATLGDSQHGVQGLAEGLRHAGGDDEGAGGAEAVTLETVLFRQGIVLAIAVAGRREPDEQGAAHARFGDRKIGEAVVLQIRQVDDVAVDLGVDAAEQFPFVRLQAGKVGGIQMLPLRGVRHTVELTEVTAGFAVGEDRSIGRRAEARGHPSDDQRKGNVVISHRLPAWARRSEGTMGR